MWPRPALGPVEIQLEIKSDPCRSWKRGVKERAREEGAQDVTYFRQIQPGAAASKCFDGDFIQERVETDPI